MAYYEESRVKAVCKKFVNWNGWGPPTSEYQILEFCRAKATDNEESDEFRDILMEWLLGNYSYEVSLYNVEEDHDDAFR